MEICGHKKQSGAVSVDDNGGGNSVNLSQAFKNHRLVSRLSFVDKAEPSSQYKYSIHIPANNH